MRNKDLRKYDKIMIGLDISLLILFIVSFIYYGILCFFLGDANAIAPVLFELTMIALQLRILIIEHDRSERLGDNDEQGGSGQ